MSVQYVLYVFVNMYCMHLCVVNVCVHVCMYACMHVFQHDLTYHRLSY